MHISLQVVIFRVLSHNLHIVAKFVYLLFPMLGTIQFALTTFLFILYLQITL